MVYGRDSDATDAGLSGRHSLSRSGSVANLDDVFDDPAHGDVGRDRLGVHFAWEGVLLLGAVVLGYLLFANHRDAVTGAGLKELLVFGSVIGMLALGAAISLRVAAPNLALGSIAMASGLYYAKHGGETIISSSITPLAVAMGVGLGIALIVVGFHVPGWAASLVAALVAIAWIQHQFQSDISVSGDFNPNNRAYYLFGGFAVLSIVAGLLGLIKPIRRGVGRFRPVSDPAVRRGGLAATVTALGLVLSSGLAAAAGIILAAAAGTAGRMVSPSTGIEFTALALGAALVGGVSAFGRRGGVFGTILGTVLIVLVMTYGTRAGWNISDLVLAAGAVTTGLIVTRLVETFGRPLELGGPDDWSDVGVGGTTGWSTAASGDPWSGLSSAPASPSPTTTTTTQWGDTDRWR